MGLRTRKPQIPMEPSKDGLSSDGLRLLQSPATLPCGKVLPNRVVKASMYEALGPFGGGPPNSTLVELYKAWAAGGWGMIITGHIMVDPKYLGLGQEIISPMPSTVPAWAEWNTAIKSISRTSLPPLTIVQLNHTGRQSIRGLLRAPWVSTVAPSSIPFQSHEGLLGQIAFWSLFCTPREITVKEIWEVVEMYRQRAVCAREAGWDGVQLHCAHGYLLSDFLSHRKNHRTDAYGGTPENRIRIVLEIISAIRSSVPSSFVVGIKLNSTDFIKGGLSEDDALLNAKMLAEHGGIDFIEVSGGTYEVPDFVAPAGASDHPYFSSFAASCTAAFSDLPNPPLVVLTGNIRSRAEAIQALQTSTAQLCAFGRPSAVEPDFAAKLLDENVKDDDAVARSYRIIGGDIMRSLPVKVIGSSVESFYHSFMMARIARGQTLDTNLSFWSLAVRHLWSSSVVATVLGLVVAVPLLVIVTVVLLPPLFVVYLVDRVRSRKSKIELE